MAKDFVGCGGITSSAELLLYDDAKFPGNTKGKTAEQRLWRAVIMAAWYDAFLAADIWLIQSERKAADPGLLRGEARRFLTSNIEPWQTERQDVCDLDGEVDADLLRAAALKRLELARDGDVKRREKQFAKLDEAFEDLMRCEGTMTKGDITRRLKMLANREENI